jgi:hypothetical protein
MGWKLVSFECVELGFGYGCMVSWCWMCVVCVVFVILSDGVDENENVNAKQQTPQRTTTPHSQLIPIPQYARITSQRPPRSRSNNTHPSHDDSNCYSYTQIRTLSSRAPKGGHARPVGHLPESVQKESSDKSYVIPTSGRVLVSSAIR